MKTKILTLILITLFAITNQSCKKAVIEGCTDATATNYLKSAQKDDGSCKYDIDNTVHTSTLTTTDWNNGGTYYYISFTWAEITQDIVNNGTVLIYFQNGSYWVALPSTFYFTGYSETWSFGYKLGGAEVDVIDSDGTLPGYPGTVTFKLIAFSGNRNEEMERNHIDKTNYEVVKKFLNLTD